MAGLKRLLIAGDSYMSQDRRSTAAKAGIHWSLHMGPEFEVHNWARPGSSNAMINIQVMQGLEQVKPDFVVIGFAFHWRLEFESRKTNCNVDMLADPRKRQLWQSYCTTVPEEIEQHRNLAVAQHAVMTSALQVPTVYLLNNLVYAAEKSQTAVFQDFLNQQFHISLVGHQEWEPNDPQGCCFHVSDAQVHQDLAQALRQHWFDTAQKNQYN